MVPQGVNRSEAKRSPRELIRNFDKNTRMFALLQLLSLDIHKQILSGIATATSNEFAAQKCVSLTETHHRNYRQCDRGANTIEIFHMCRLGVFQ